MTPHEIIIDGSRGEGGGQILRTSIGLAAALGLRVRIRDIRAHRPKPGLRAQHLAAVRAAAAVCDAEVAGDEPGSLELSFAPQKAHGGNFHFDIGTAGSTMLVCQTVLPALAVCGQRTHIVVTGGTHNPLAPCFEYVRDVYNVLGSAMNLRAYFELVRAGFYPAGGGEALMEVDGLSAREEVAPLRLASRGGLKYVDGVAAVSRSLPEHIVERQHRQVLGRLAQAGHRASIEQLAWDSHSPGTVVFLRAVFDRSVAGFFALGPRGKPAEQVADEAVDGLLAFIESDAVVDAHAADQLLTLAALSPEESHFHTERVTAHLTTNAEVIRRLTGRQVIIDEDGLVTLPGE